MPSIARRLFVATIGLSIAATSHAPAQNTLPIPAFVRTYTNAQHTRGLQFQAPVAMTITGLRVPDESMHGMQNVAVYRLQARAPLYPTTANTPPVFYQAGTPSATTIQTAIAFQAGEWVAILGACGDATTMRNSYGQTEPFQTTIRGMATSMWRFGSQTNIVANQGMVGYFSFAAEVGRIEVDYATASIVGSGSGQIGTALPLALVAPASGGKSYVCGTSLGTGPIPIDTRRLGLSADTVLVTSATGVLPTVFAAYAGVLSASGTGQATLNIPNLPALVGVQLSSAFLTLDATAPSGIDDVSNTFTFRIQ